MKGAPLRLAEEPQNMCHCRRMHFWILASALLAAGGCGRQSHDEGLVRLSVTSGAAMAYLPVYVAGRAGCLAREGVQVQLDETAGSVKSVEALLGGSVDVAACDYLTLLNVVSQGQPLREFVLLQKIPGLVAIVSPKASRPIRSLQDVKGRTVAVNARGNAYHRLWDQILRLHGVNPDEVSVVSVGTGMSAALSLERGVVDVGLSSILGASYLERRYPSLTILVDTRTPESTRAALGTDEIAFFILCAREDWLRAHPHAARQLASAMQCALAWVHDHSPQQLRETLPDSSRSPDAESDFDALASAKGALSLDGRMTPGAHASAVRFLTTADSTKPKSQEPYTNEFLRE